MVLVSCVVVGQTVYRWFPAYIVIVLVVARSEKSQDREW